MLPPGDATRQWVLRARSPPPERVPVSLQVALQLTEAGLMFPVMTQLTEHLVLKPPSGVLWVWDAARVMDAAGTRLCQGNEALVHGS